MLLSKLTKTLYASQNFDTHLVYSVDRAVFRAGLGVRAQRGVPLVAGVAVGGGVDGVGPPPVGVQDDGALHGRATAVRGALLPGQGQRLLGGQRASALYAYKRRIKDL